jgi:hypothetical protein
MATSPNLICIVLDGVTQLRVDLDGPRSSINPCLTKLASNGTYFSNFFSTGNPTEFSMPSMFSSSLPLDFGGYQFGLKNRPDNLFNYLKQNGYASLLLSNSHILDRVFGFDKGFDLVANMYNLDLIWQCMKKIYLWHIINEREKIGENEFLKKAARVVERFFTAIIDYCTSRNSLPDYIRVNLAGSKNRDFGEIHRRMLRELENLRSNSEEYISINLIKLMELGIEGFLDIKLKNPRLRNFLNKFNGKKIPATHITIKTIEKQISAETSFKLARKWIDNNLSQPFVTAIHVMDIHDDLYSSHKNFMLPPKFDSKLKSILSTDWEKQKNEMALFYFDTELDKFLKSLPRAIKENTVIAITSDHGANTLNGKTPLSSSGMTGSFHDEYLHIPFILNGPGIPKHKSFLLGNLVDFAPTVCEALRLPAHVPFKGKSLLNSSSGSEYVCSEHTHRGPCEPLNKPIYMCLRTLKHKYIVKEGRAPNDLSPRDEEILIDLENDNSETINTIGLEDKSLVVEKFRNLAKNRILDIKRQAKQTTL